MSLTLAEKLILVALTACLAAAIPRAAQELWPRPGEYDFQAFYVAARAVASGQSPYSAPALDAAAADAHCCRGITSYTSYPYPPWHAGLLWPIARLSYESAAWVWYAMNVAFLLLAVWLVCTETSLQLTWPNVVILGSLFPYADYTLRLGQMTPLILAAVLLAARAMRHSGPGRDVLGGALVGVAGALKIFPLLCAFPFLARGRRWAVLGTAFGLFAAIGLGCLTPAARASLGDWFTRVAPEIASGASGIPPQQSLQGTTMRLLAPVRVLPAVGDSVTSRPLLVAPRAARVVGMVLAGVVGMLALAAPLRRRRWTEPRPGLFPELALMLATLTLVVTIAWDHYFVMLLPAEAVLLARWRDRRGRWLLLGGALLLAAHRFWRVLALARTATLLSLGTAGALLVWLGIWLVVWAGNAEPGGDRPEPAT